LVAFSDPNVWTPISIRANKVSSWHGSDNAADYLVISPAEFMGAVAPLKALREGQGHSVAMVDVEDIYDEFSFGQKTPYALREFLTRAKVSWSRAPKFAVLVGNATTDPRNYLGMDEPDY